MLSEIDEIEIGDRETGVRGQAGKLFDYYRNGDLNDFAQWCEDVSNVSGGTVSRAEAAKVLRCSRQRIHQIVRSGRVRCWHFHGGFLRDESIYSEISVLDLLAYSDRVGRPVAEIHASAFVSWNDEVQEYFDRRRQANGKAVANEQPWMKRWQELGEQIDREWKSDKSAAEIVSEMRR